MFHVSPCVQMKDSGIPPKRLARERKTSSNPYLTHSTLTAFRESMRKVSLELAKRRLQKFEQVMLAQTRPVSVSLGRHTGEKTVRIWCWACGEADAQTHGSNNWAGSRTHCWYTSKWTTRSVRDDRFSLSFLSFHTHALVFINDSCAPALGWEVTFNDSSQSDPSKMCFLFHKSNLYTEA